ncbi:MAG: hypothetical protein KAS99_02435 [Candidatus Omnitrophica bacterium]|nr:hypothetical protein [Candidatus Omnitrophota bacterium]
MDSAITKITPLKFGQVLFVLSLKEYETFKKDKNLLKSLDLMEIKNEYHFFQEMIVANLFAISQSMQGALKNRDLEFLILDYMNETYFSYLQTELKLNNSMLNDQKKLFLLRFKEYNNALSEKRGPNILWPLACHIINNLRKEDIKDSIMVMKMMAHYSYLIQYYSTIITKYQVVQ